MRARTFTQGELDHVLAVERKTTQDVISRLKEEIKTRHEELAAQQTTTKEFLDQILNPPQPPADPFDAYVAELTVPPEIAKNPQAARVYEKVARERWAQQRELSELRQTLDVLKLQSEQALTGLKTEREAREKAESAAHTLRLQNTLASILRKHKVIDPDLVSPVFMQSLVWDEVGERVAYRAPDGTLLDADAEVGRRIPDWWRQPATLNGGSGASGGRTTDVPPETTLQQLEAKRVQLVANTRPDTRTVAELQQVNRQIRKAKEALQSARVV